MRRVYETALGVIGALAIVAAVVFVGVAGVNALRADDNDASERLPDLDQETPSQLSVQAALSHGHVTYRLGFRSAVVNVGAGPLIVHGHRADTSQKNMTVDQVIVRDGEPKIVNDVGQMRYTVSPDHRHWHYLQFDRYELQRSELRRAGTDHVLVRDQKTGFCLGDRYRTPARLLARPPRQPVFTGRCGLSQPQRLHVREGISVGYGDDYNAFLEGQDLPLDGLPDGRYVLVHRVNATHDLHEISYDNNAASVLLQLRWYQGRPYVRVLNICPATDRCDRPDARTTASKG